MALCHGTQANEYTNQTSEHWWRKLPSQVERFHYKCMITNPNQTIGIAQYPCWNSLGNLHFRCP